MSIAFGQNSKLDAAEAVAAAVSALKRPSRVDNRDTLLGDRGFALLSTFQLAG
jgi:hypothetical protein